MSSPEHRAGGQARDRVEAKLTDNPQALGRVLDEFPRRGLPVLEMQLTGEGGERRLTVLTRAGQEPLRRLQGALEGSSGVSDVSIEPEEGPFAQSPAQAGPPETLEDRTVAVVGYGSQGRAQAANLRDVGIDVLVGARADGSSWDKARADGHDVREIRETVREGDVIMLLVPDEVHREVYEAKVQDNLTAGDALVLAHGFTVWSGQLELPDEVDVGLVAPKAPGAKVRSSFQQETGVPVLVGVEQDATGGAWPLVDALARGIGAGAGQLVETTFAEETETDLFGEQAVLCGGLTSLVRQGFEMLVEAGYQPEVAYFEVVNEMKLIVDLVHEGGLEHMWANVSNTAEYGGRTRGPEVIDEPVRENMQAVLDNVRDGSFAEEWIEQQTTNGHGREGRLAKLRARGRKMQIERVGREVRDKIAAADADGSSLEGSGDR